MNKRRLNPDDFRVETFVAGKNPLATVGPASPTVLTTCSPTCDTTISGTVVEA
ncbi:MAG: hypothetical protein JO306_12910 [Gemmatimonadetes bacterium]|nr:hypothetical protein [Gemmatimonadota bacterium]